MFRLAWIGLLPVLLSASTLAQTSLVVTEAGFLSVLDDNHPAVAERSQDVAMARARVVAASTLENPTLAVVREDPSGPVEQTDWSISWQIPERDRRLRIEAGEATVAAAEARLAQDLLALRLTMRQVYADWAIATARRERLSAQAAHVEALAARETTRAEGGEASGLEAHRLRLAAAGLQAKVALAEVAAETARSGALSWRPNLAAGARPVLPLLPQAPDLEQSHPLLRAAQADLGAAMLERQAAGRFVRSPEVVVGWQRQEAGPESVDGPILGFSWSVPLFARNQSEQALTEARVEAARARMEVVRREVAATRTAATATYQNLTTAVANARAALAGNEKMLTGAEAAFRHGETSLTDLLETLRSATESEMAVLDLHEAALAAHRKLSRLAGLHGVPDEPTHTTEESIP